MGYFSEKMRCSDESCAVTYDDLIDKTQRDEAHECRSCGQITAYRTMTVPNISTSKLSATIPDVVASGRFDRIRDQSMLKKEKARARERGDRETEKKVNKELQQVKSK